MAVGDGEVEGVAEELFHDEAGAFDGEADDGDVEQAFENLIDEFGGGAFADMEVDFGIALGEFLKDGREEVGKDGGDGADAEGAPDAFLHAFEVFRERGGVFEQCPRLAENGLAEGSELDAAVEAFKQRGAEDLFQFGDLFGEGGLGDAEIVGGFGEAARAGDGAEVLQLPEIEAADAGDLSHRKIR